MRKSTSAICQMLGGSIVLCILPVPAGAQSMGQQPQQVDKIVVTGSNVKRIDVDGPIPIQIIKREQIEQSGASTVSDLLRFVTANNAGGANERTSSTAAPGSAGISLRGLGQTATLVLVNGRRVANFGFARSGQENFV